MITIVYLIFSLFVVSCSHEQSHNKLLTEAEQIVVEQPDSVVRMLEPCWDDTTLSAPDRALFGLLYTEALHRSGLSTESDSLILTSRRYYERENDKPRLARALLHHAIVLYKQQQTHEAVLTMKRAEQLAEKVDDPMYNCYLYFVLGDINDNVGNYPQTLKYYKQALNAARQCHKDEWIVRALNNIAQTFDMTGRMDSLQYYTEQAEPYAPHTDGEIRATYLTNQASYLLHMDKRQEAKQLLLRAQQTSPTDRGAKLLADVYLAEKDTASAAQQWYSLLNSFSPDVAISSYRKLIGYLTMRGENNQAAFYSLRLNEVYHDLYSRDDTASIIDLQAQFDEQQKERQQYRITIMLLSAILLLILAAIAAIWYSRRRIDRLNARFLESQQKYDLTRSELTRMRKQKEREERENSEELKAVVARIHASANKGRAISDDDMNELAQRAYALNPNLQLLLSALNAKEQAVCLLIRHNFLPTEIATLTISTPQTITNTRVRLLKKLFGETGGAKDFDTRLKEFE
ncbi:lipopolysaccharide assembly protein LapB [Prevotella sp. P6B4]|uniref:tetratricopeptide repeat protein n=1 Tax=Prevotella sp. P6B4 TaxID=1410614 RepID=UPI0012DF8F07|nr:tetratricopeptide repeat protein [Prevotella sp. P6B4]